MSDLDEFFAALSDVGEGRAETVATSIRQPEALRRAAQLATELGMDESVTAASNHALEDRLRAFARQRAIVAHLDRFPEDRPSLAAVAGRRIRGTGHPAARRPDLVADVAGWLEQRRPDWAVAPDMDQVVDNVLDHVEMLSSGIGERPAASA